MNRLLVIILMVILGLGLAGAAAWYVLTNRADTTNQNVAGTANLNQITVAPTNTQPRNVNLSTEVKGQTVLNGKIVADGVELKISSLDKVITFQSTTAPKDHSFFVVYFDPIKSTDVLKVNDFLKRQAHVTTSDGNINQSGLKIAGDSTANDRGYLKFLVPNKAKDVVLEIGSGAEAQRVSLPQ